MYSTITTVVTPANSYDLTTLAKVKDELGITVSTYDTILGRYITSASAAAAQFCNRVFVAETVKDTLYADKYMALFRSNVDALQLARWPLVSITSVVVDGITLVENTDFVKDIVRGQLTRIDSSADRTAWCGRLIVVNYQGGYSTIPTDLEDAIIRMVTKRYLAKGRDPSLKQESVPGVREVQYWIATGAEAGNMTPDILDILDNYRTPNIGA